ncbi:MAG: RNA polymerase sigma factor [Oligoflexia bacterium]|nr:RNA polymerase sigma factor [Oligoflexia bacterium]
MARASERLDIAALYRRYGDMVYGRCLSMLRNEADAVEATQEVFLKAHRHADGFKGNAKASTWLYRIATNQCLNVIRTRKRHPEDPVEDVAQHVPLASAPVGDSIVQSLALRQLVERLLEGWDERTQQCVVYHFMDGMTQDEVGALLGISGAAVRKRLAKFRKTSLERFPDWVAWER